MASINPDTFSTGGSAVDTGATGPTKRAAKLPPVSVHVSHARQALAIKIARAAGMKRGGTTLSTFLP